MEVHVFHATITTLTVLILVLLFLVLAFIPIFLAKRRKQESKIHERNRLEDSTAGFESSPEGSVPANDEGTYLYFNTETALPTHICLHKDANLKEKAKNMSIQIENLEEEFFNLVEYVNENVKNEKNIATQGDNKEHNRYIDIGKNQLSFFMKYSFSSI